MRKEFQRIDPLGLSIAREELFIEAYVPFGVYTSCGLSWGPLDGAVDGFIVEVFVGVEERAIVWAYVVSFPGEEVFEFAKSGI